MRNRHSHGHGHHRGHAGPWGLRHYVRARLHRRLFVSMGAAILVSLLLSLGMAAWWGKKSMDFDPAQVEQLIGGQFARVWDQPHERVQLADQLARAFSVSLRVEQTKPHVVSQHGGVCQVPRHSVSVRASDGATLGQVGVCLEFRQRGARASWLLAPLIFALVLWISSGLIAHRLGRPLGKLVEVTREIGAGKLSSRARLGRHEVGELGILAESINDMASRIEKQLDDQKELLAAVSHEMRTPLARLRVISELLESQAAPSKLTQEMQREIVELDDLIGQLLASSRLEFHALRPSSHDAFELTRSSLLRLGLDPLLLNVNEKVKGERTLVWGDATLLSRALLNLFQNAQTHGGGVHEVHVFVRPDGAVEFSVVDRGSGFTVADLKRVFDSFYRGKGSGTLGLGLSLVRRIAQAHGGDAAAQNVVGGGARVSFWVAAAAHDAVPVA